MNNFWLKKKKETIDAEYQLAKSNLDKYKDTFNSNMSHLELTTWTQGYEKLLEIFQEAYDKKYPLQTFTDSNGNKFQGRFQEADSENISRATFLKRLRRDEEINEVVKNNKITENVNINRKFRHKFPEGYGSWRKQANNKGISMFAQSGHTFEMNDEAPIEKGGNPVLQTSGNLSLMSDAVDTYHIEITKGKLVEFQQGSCSKITVHYEKPTYLNFKEEENAGRS